MNRKGISRSYILLGALLFCWMSIPKQTADALRCFSVASFAPAWGWVKGLQSYLSDRPQRLWVEKKEEDGERLPATYANFLILNDAILYPTYNQPQNDKKAGEVLQQAFPGRQIVGIDCRALIKQHGSLHCVTMQYPTGVIK